MRAGGRCECLERFRVEVARGGRCVSEGRPLLRQGGRGRGGEGRASGAWLERRLVVGGEPWEGVGSVRKGS